MTHDQFWADYQALKAAVQRTGYDVSDALHYLERIGRAFPAPSFPEEHLIELAVKMQNAGELIQFAIGTIRQKRADEAYANEAVANLTARSREHAEMAEAAE